MDGNRHFVIAIDGPAGSGKSTVAAGVAERLDATLFDTGAVYRALTLLALESGVRPSDERALVDLASALKLRIGQPSVVDGRQYDVWLDERDITWKIRAAVVDRFVSEVAAHPAVRRSLLAIQRNIASAGRVVMPGRDVGTVIVPDADLKIWLDASLDERARRRHREVVARGDEREFDIVRRELESRDALDGGREVAPMRAADDAIRIDTEHLTAVEVVECVLELARTRCLTKVNGREDG